VAAGGVVTASGAPQFAQKRMAPASATGVALLGGDQQAGDTCQQHHDHADGGDHVRRVRVGGTGVAAGDAPRNVARLGDGGDPLPGPHADGAQRHAQAPPAIGEEAEQAADADEHHHCQSQVERGRGMKSLVKLSPKRSAVHRDQRADDDGQRAQRAEHTDRRVERGNRRRRLPLSDSTNATPPSTAAATANQKPISWVVVSVKLPPPLSSLTSCRSKTDDLPDDHAHHPGQGEAGTAGEATCRRGGPWPRAPSRPPAAPRR
jgi:hypothetical protein